MCNKKYINKDEQTFFERFLEENNVIPIEEQLTIVDLLDNFEKEK